MWFNFQLNVGLVPKEIEWNPSTNGTIRTANMVKTGNRYDFFAFLDATSGTSGYINLSLPFVPKYNSAFTVSGTNGSTFFNGYISAGRDQLIVVCPASGKAYTLLVQGVAYE